VYLAQETKDSAVSQMKDAVRNAGRLGRQMVEEFQSFVLSCER